MSSLTTHKLMSQPLKELVKSNVYKRHTITPLRVAALMNVDNRLRIKEDQYCDNYSSPIQQPYRNILESLTKRTEKDFSNPYMLSGDLQRKFMCQLIKFFKPKNALEIGSFTGCSAIAMGSCLLPDAKLTTLEMDTQCVKVAREYIEMAQLQDKVFVKEGLALNRYTAIVYKKRRLMMI